jgi:5-methylcytosine-specific restriction endonuclease McrA
VRERDHGVCAICGFDTMILHRLSELILSKSRTGAQRWEVQRGLVCDELAKRMLLKAADAGRAARERLVNEAYGYMRRSETYRWRAAIIHAEHPRHHIRVVTAAKVWLRMAERYGWTRHRLEKGSEPWDADHIVPLSEGGDFGLENIRTLCLPCHKRETSKLLEHQRARKEFVRAARAELTRRKATP